MKKNYTNLFVLRNLITFRTIENNDIDRVLEIYNFYIENGTANFEETSFSYKDFKNLSQNTLNSNLPFIVAEIDKKIIGFAYLSSFRNKSGYRHSFENSIYIDKKFIGKGIGYSLLHQLIKSSLKNSKIKTIIAVIGGKNTEASIRIHKKNGFKIVGTLKKVGFKNNQWLNSVYMQKILNEKN